MKRLLFRAVPIALLLLAPLLSPSVRSRLGLAPAPDAPWVTVEAAPFLLWTDIEGELAARNVTPVFSGVNGPATLVFLAPEGQPVHRGDVVARFDAFQIEQELNRLDREAAVAEAEARMLENATLPLELAELRASLFEARGAWQTEASMLTDCADLVKDGLMSPQELDQTRMKADGLKARVEQLETRLRLTQDQVHPARLKEAGAKRDAACRQRDSMREQLAHTTVESPSDGELVFVALALGGERRTARIGDTIYRNQEFLCIPDPSAWVARGMIPEQDLSRVRTGLPVRVTPRAFPGITLTGAVETVAAMGQMDPRAPGRRVFPVTIRVDNVPPQMKSGLSVHLRLLSREDPRVLQIPRAAVRWENGMPTALVRTGSGRTTPRDLTLGDGNERMFEVLSGLEPGDRIAP